MKNFQTILLIVFGVFFALGMAIFSGFLPIGKKSQEAQMFSGEVTIWGTYAPDFFKPYFDPLQQDYDELQITYVQKNASTYYEELVQALAAGVGPDVFFLDHDRIVEHANKVLPIPYENYPKETFVGQFVDMARLYMAPSGILALPFVADPLVLYYNRDLLNSAFILEPPKTWDELVTMSAQLTRKDDAGKISLSAIGLGTPDNVNYVKDILATLAMQDGVFLVGQGNDGAYVESLYGQNTDGGLASALRFYTSFAMPAQKHVSWNGGMRNNKDAFIAEESVFYIGYASELTSLRVQNPNLNFDVTLLPQTKNSKLQATTASMTALAISKQSDNVTTAYNLITLLTNPDYNAVFSEALRVPPIRREVLVGNVPAEPYMRVFYNSMIIARSWWDPNALATDVIFRRMVTQTLSGVQSAENAVRDARADIRRLLGQK